MGRRPRDAALGLGRELVERVAVEHHLPHAVARDVVIAVARAVEHDLRRAEAALASGDPDLGLAARVLACRLDWACTRFARGQAGGTPGQQT